MKKKWEKIINECWYAEIGQIADYFYNIYYSLVDRSNDNFTS